MCRLLTVVASEPTAFRVILREAPRSLAALSREHPDGWGIAVYDAAAPEQEAWTVNRGIHTAGDDDAFHRLAVGSRGHVLVSHIRKKTVGSTALENTHPFVQSGFVFAHNGTIQATAHVRAKTSAARLDQIRGDTDSELFFAHLLTCLDRAGADVRSDAIAIERVLRDVCEDAWRTVDFGAVNFVLARAGTVWGHRFGRTLFLLERGPDDAVRRSRESITGAVIETPWSPRRRAVFVASEALTDEPWEELPEKVLLRVDQAPEPRWSLVAKG